MRIVRQERLAWRTCKLQIRVNAWSEGPAKEKKQNITSGSSLIFPSDLKMNPQSMEGDQEELGQKHQREGSDRGRKIKTR